MRGGGSRAVFRRIPLPFLPAPPPTVLPIDHRRADVRNTPSQCGRECSCRSASVAPPSRKVVSLHPATFHPVSGPSDARRVHCRAAAPCAPGIRPHAALQVRDCVTMRDDVCCPTCKAPRVNADGTYNIIVIGRDRNGGTRCLCKHCPVGASRFVLQQQPAHAAGSAKKAKDGGAAALPADTPPEAAAGGSGARPSAHAAGSAAPVKHEEVKREEVSCPRCNAPRFNADKTYNIVVCSIDRNGSIRYLCKRCPGDASRFVLQQPADAAGSAPDAAGSAADDEDERMDRALPSSPSATAAPAATAATATATSGTAKEAAAAQGSAVGQEAVACAAPTAACSASASTTSTTATPVVRKSSTAGTRSSARSAASSSASASNSAPATDPSAAAVGAVAAAAAAVPTAAAAPKRKTSAPGEEDDDERKRVQKKQVSWAEDGEAGKLTKNQTGIIIQGPQLAYFLLDPGEMLAVVVVPCLH